MRDALSDVPAVYFVSPSGENIAKICQVSVKLSVTQRNPMVFKRSYPCVIISGRNYTDSLHVVVRVFVCQ